MSGLQIRGRASATTAEGTTSNHYISRTTPSEISSKLSSKRDTARRDCHSERERGDGISSYDDRSRRRDGYREDQGQRRMRDKSRSRSRSPSRDRARDRDRRWSRDSNQVRKAYASERGDRDRRPSDTRSSNREDTSHPKSERTRDRDDHRVRDDRHWDPERCEADRRRRDRSRDRERYYPKDKEDDKYRDRDRNYDGSRRHSHSHRRRSYSSDSGSQSESSESENTDSDEDRRRRRKRREKRKREEKEERRRRKEKKREKKAKSKTTAASTANWGKYGIISEADMGTKGSEFRSWLIEERRLNPDTLHKDKMKKEFLVFMEDYNTATLSHEKYYDLAKYQTRMNLIKSGATLPIEAEGGYNFMADVKSHKAAVDSRYEKPSATLSREEIMELRRIEKERIEIGQRRLLGLDIPKHFGVRTEEVDRTTLFNNEPTPYGFQS